MGYRYQVAIAIKPSIFEQAPDNVKEAFKEIFVNPVKTEDHRVVFYHEYIKWYDTDEVVGTIMNYMVSLNDEEYGMIIMGEEDGDIEYYGDSFQFDLGYVRTLEF